MLNPVGRAGTGVITPLVKAADATAGIDNWKWLDRALSSAGNFNGIVQLPVGPIYVENSNASALNLDESRAFVVVQGMGRDKTLLIPTGASSPLPTINFASGLVGYTKDGTFTVGGNTITLSNSADLPKYAVGDVVYFWKFQASATNNRSSRQRIIVGSTTSPNTVNLQSTIASGTPNPDNFKHIKGHAVDGTSTAHSPVPAGSTSVYLLDSGFASEFNIGDDVSIGDGPGVNEFFGEWARVTSVSGHTISFTPPLQESYASDLTCIVPGRLNSLTGRRQHMTDIVFRDLSICAPTSGTYIGQFGVVRAGARIRFHNVGLIASPFATTLQTLHEIAFATCGDLTIRDGFYDGKLLVGPCQNVTLDNIVAGSLKVGEFSRSCNILNVTTLHEPGIEVNGGLCTGVNLTNCTVRGEDAIALVYAENARIENMTAVELVLAAGSTGVLATPLAPDPTQVVDGTDPGDRLAPLQRYTDGRTFITSTAAGNVPLTIKGASSQTANLQEWKNSSGTTLVAVTAGGALGVAGNGGTGFTIVASGSVAGVDCLVSSGGSVRLGTNGEGGMIQMFNNSETYAGECYLDCGNQSTSAIILRTANNNERFRVTHNGDATFIPASASGKALIVKGASSQTANLQQWQNSSATVLLAVRADGNLATANSTTVDLDIIVKSVPIYDTSNNLLGYLPIYSSA